MPFDLFDIIDPQYTRYYMKSAEFERLHPNVPDNSALSIYYWIKAEEHGALWHYHRNKMRIATGFATIAFFVNPVLTGIFVAETTRQLLRSNFHHEKAQLALGFYHQHRIIAEKRIGQSGEVPLGTHSSPPDIP